MEHLVKSVRIKTFDLTRDLKVIPVQSWTGAEGSRWLWPPDFKTIGT